MKLQKKDIYVEEYIAPHPHMLEPGGCSPSSGSYVQIPGFLDILQNRRFQPSVFSILISFNSNFVALLIFWRILCWTSRMFGLIFSEVHHLPYRKNLFL